MYDFIIVGSGVSGGPLAKELHASGAKILLIEAGKFLRKQTFPDNEMQYSSELYWGGGIEFDTLARTAFLRAKVVGGTSIVNQCLSDRFDDLAWNDWKAESGIDFFSSEKMKPWYEKTESNMILHTFNATEGNRNATLFRESCNSLGYGTKFLRRGQSDCKLEEGNDCVGCLGGCFRDSKQSSLVTSILKAEKEGLEIKSEFEVTGIEHFNDKVKIHGLAGGKKETLECRHLCLAGGSFGTTKLLLNSGYKSKLPALGKGFTQHPQFMFFGVFDEPVDAHKGAFQTMASDDMRFRKQGYKLENVYAQPISIGMLFREYGKRHQELMMKFRYMSCIEVAVRDDPSGEISVDKKGNLVIKKYLTDQDMKRRDAGLETMRNIFAKQGAKEIIESPFFFGLHLMGGCAMGTDKVKSVTGPDFRVHGLKNISVSDSSVFPNAPGINPSLTIATLSYYHASLLLKP